MTAIVGLHCSDGVVIGTDSSTTFAGAARPTIEQPTRKIDIVGGRVIVATTGAVGLAQRFRAVAQKIHDDKLFKDDAGKVANANAASTTVTVDADYTVQANFSIDQHS